MTRNASSSRELVPAAVWRTGPSHSDVVSKAVDGALRGFPRALEGKAVPASTLQSFQRVGQLYARTGMKTTELLAAVSSTADVAVRQLTELGLRSGVALTAPEIARLIGVSLTYFDQLRLAAVTGYGDIDVPRTEMGTARARLIKLLLGRRGQRGRPGHAADPADRADDVAGWQPASLTDSERLEEAAARAGWSLPASVAVTAVDCGGSRGPLPGFLPPDLLTVMDEDTVFLIVPDPSGPGRRAMVEQIVADHPAAVGPTVPPAHTAASLRLALRGLRRLPAAMLTAGTPVHVIEHIPAMLLTNCPDITGHLIKERLAPLNELRPAQRDRLAETLLACFECGFNTPEVAARVHVHQQTIRYRLRQLDDMFGPELRDPEHALDYLMALYALRLRDQT
ncbi:helix-turn-helix domain-containing protein [Actinomadura barringtoniae]|uniref:Helix-turn-helix domain-containing protein n=1 Tax=Actinomadura barringtoniae TaxID=1427535 RepID=A0A939P8H6_9ACTN|nr:helix-turn-helix domain-containing protein [Actinomadura barringtoniae]MBO2447675.1 helix-turn-helix domain-containing protein [Actinomadura barringtoniae]